MRHRRRAERWQDEAEKIGQRPVDELQLDDQDDELVRSLTPAKCYGVSTIRLRSRQRRTRQVHEIAPPRSATGAQLPHELSALLTDSRPTVVRQGGPGVWRAADPKAPIVAVPVTKPVSHVLQLRTAEWRSRHRSAGAAVSRIFLMRNSKGVPVL